MSDDLLELHGHLLSQHRTVNGSVKEWECKLCDVICADASEYVDFKCEAD